MLSLRLGFNMGQGQRADHMKKPGRKKKVTTFCRDLFFCSGMTLTQTQYPGHGSCMAHLLQSSSIT